MTEARNRNLPSMNVRELRSAAPRLPDAGFPVRPPPVQGLKRSGLREKIPPRRRKGPKRTFLAGEPVT